MEPWETYQITIIIFDQNSNDDDNSVTYFVWNLAKRRGKKLEVKLESVSTAPQFLLYAILLQSINVYLLLAKVVIINLTG